MKEWKGLIEKEFTLVHYADMKIENEKRNYFIELHSDGTSSGKTPPMFVEENEERIANNYAPFIERVEKKLSEQ